jgi:hypothetical protein
MGKILYVIVGSIVLAGAAVAEWSGWGASPVTEVKNVPRTVRSNPGSYRPHYTYFGSSYRRGK